MHAVIAYFRQHPWQRRTITLLLAVVAGLALGRFSLYPWWRNRTLLADLASADSARRETAVTRAATVAQRDQDFHRLLIDKLDTPDDRQFAGLAQTLDALGDFYSPSRQRRHVLRRKRLTYAAALPSLPSATTTVGTQPADDTHRSLRLSVVGEFVRQHCAEDEAIKLLRLAVKDPDAEVRAQAAVLAVMCKADEAAGAFLADDNPQVRARATVALALAGRGSLLCQEGILEGPPLPGVPLPTGQILPRLERAWLLAQDEDEIGATALAMALVDREQTSGRIAARLATSDSESLRDKLYWAACLLPAECFDKADSRWLAKQDGSSMPLLLAGRQRFGAEVVRQALAEPWTKETLTVRDATRQAAAAWAARQLDLEVSVEMDKLMRQLYQPETATVMMQAALTLAHAADLEARAHPERADEIRRQAIATLQAASAMREVPMAAAAAAFALWQLDTSVGQAPLLSAASTETSLAGDWLAWHLAHSDAAAARQIARQLLDVPYIYDAKAAGAMMLALASRDDPDAAAEARKLIEDRIGPPGDPLVRDPYLLESYNCSLLLLGRTDLADHVRKLLMIPTFPQRRLLTTLLLSGDRAAFEWLLANSEIDPVQLDYLLGNKTLGEVLVAVRPDLPRYEPLAPPAVRLWQARIILDAYALRPTK